MSVEKATEATYKVIGIKLSDNKFNFRVEVQSEFSVDEDGDPISEFFSFPISEYPEMKWKKMIDDTMVRRFVAKQKEKSEGVIVVEDITDLKVPGAKPTNQKFTSYEEAIKGTKGPLLGDVSITDKVNMRIDKLNEEGAMEKEAFVPGNMVKVGLTKKGPEKV
jgi:hypothetical protein